MKPHGAQGWYRDPYALHEDRYFSAGRPTELVRDAGKEAYDDPPDRAYDPADLVSAEPETADVLDAADLRRADEADRSGAPYNAGAAKRAAFDVFDQMMRPN